MTFLTKFPRTKLFTVIASFMATAIVWSALAWPDWTAANTDNAWVAQDPQVVALQALAALPPEQLAALAAPEVAPAPEPPAPRQIIHQTVVIRRTVPGPTYIIPDEPQPSGDAAYVVAPTASEAGDVTDSTSPAPARPSAPAPPPAAARRPRRPHHQRPLQSRHPRPRPRHRPLRSRRPRPHRRRRPRRRPRRKRTCWWHTTHFWLQ